MAFLMKTYMKTELECVSTKRKILKCVVQLYDPHGLISSLTILDKVIIQNIWRVGLDWDEPVAFEISTR